MDPWSEGPWVTVRVPLEEGLADVTAIDVTTRRVAAREIATYHGRAFATP